jgi:hypothetical protein
VAGVLPLLVLVVRELQDKVILEVLGLVILEAVEAVLGLRPHQPFQLQKQAMAVQD